MLFLAYFGSFSIASILWSVALFMLSPRHTSYGPIMGEIWLWGIGMLFAVHAGAFVWHALM